MSENRMFRKYFSVAEANNLIPEVAGLVKQIQSLLEEAQDKLWQLREAKEQARRRGEAVDPDRFMSEEAELDFLKLLTQTQIRRIQELGAILQDVHVGLVDFPTRLDDEDVLLCWRMGETAISAYHSLADGFVGRKPLPPHLAGEATSPADGGEPGGADEPPPG